MEKQDITRSQFLRMLYLSEVMLVLATLLLGYIFFGHPLPFQFSFDGIDALMGALLALPPAMIVAMMYSRIGEYFDPIRRASEGILTKLKGFMGTALAETRHHEIVLISIAAGIGEEMFFRGFLQTGLGLAPAALIFGLMHALTPAYFVIATLIGVYLGLIYEASNNLLPAIITHALYDIYALYMLRYLFRRTPRAVEQL